MNLSRNPQLCEVLAARYALGVLRGHARRRFETLMQGDASLRALAARWQEHFVGLAEAVAPLPVPARVWRALERRIPTLGRTPVRRNWFHSLAMWRATAGLAAAVAVISLGISWSLSVNQRAPIEATAPANAHYVATFADPKTGRAVALVYADAQGQSISFKILDASLQVSADQVLELWTAAPEGKGMLPAGLVPIATSSGVQSFTVPDAQRFREAHLIGLSLEPAGGSPAPTHVLGVASWVRIET